MPKFVQYLGKALPPTVFGMPVMYCLKAVGFLEGAHGLPELLAIVVTVGLHLRKRQMLIFIAGGTLVYMLLLNIV